MYSQSQYSTSSVNDDVTFVENILLEENCNNFTNNIWNSDLHSEPIQNYETQQWIQETSLNLYKYQSHEEPKSVYQNITAQLPVNPIGYQEANYYNISQNYSSNQSRHNLSVHNTFQEQIQQQILPRNLIQQGSCFIENQQKLYHNQNNYINKKAGLKGVGKRKRKRTMFTTEQVAVLEKVFLSKPYINRDERQALVEELQINDKVIKVWFQNRRLKEKREAEEAAQELYSPDAEANETQYKFDELSYVESQINQTDNLGYVTLDDRAINGLVSVIDNLLSQRTEINLMEERHIDEVPKTSQDAGINSAVYEPISPASSECTSSEESTNYEAFEPQETIQRIFDMKEFLVFNKKECCQTEIVI